MDQLIDKVRRHVQEYMGRFDASHDYNHVQRVFHLAKIIQTREQDSHPTVRYRPHVVALASLLHDVGDRKYLRDGEDGALMVENLLLAFGAPAALAREVQAIVNHVSYSGELKDPGKVQRVLAEHPELAVVQDADRLDAIGAVGVGRCFAYSAAAGRGGLEGAVVHFGEKLERLEEMMKTGAGRGIAAERTRRVREFRGWWDEEVAFSGL